MMFKFRLFENKKPNNENVTGLEMLTPKERKLEAFRDEMWDLTCAEFFTKFQQICQQVFGAQIEDQENLPRFNIYGYNPESDKDKEDLGSFRDKIVAIFRSLPVECDDLKIRLLKIIGGFFQQFNEKDSAHIPSYALVYS